MPESQSPYSYKNSASLQYRADIDGLRALAVLSVMGYHGFPQFFQSGFVGVDIFFVISGFLISSILLGKLEQENFSFWEFYSRRIKRIFPALFFVLATCFFMGWYVLLAPEFKQLGKHIAGGAGFISNFILWGESGYFDSSAESKPLLHLWSLGIEEQFYIVWPFILWAAWKMRLPLLGVILTIAISSFVFNLHSSAVDGIASFYSPQTRVWELLLGASLAYIAIKNGRKNSANNQLEPQAGTFTIYFKNREILIKRSEVLSTVGLFLLILSFILISPENRFPGWICLLPTLGSVMLIAAGENGWFNRVLSGKPLVIIGLISFPLYLWHWCLLSFAHVAGVGKSTPVTIGLLLLSVVLAWFTYRLIEKPIRFGKHDNLKAGALVFVMMIAGMLGLHSYKKEGFADRFPKIVQEIAAFEYDYKKEYRYGTCFLQPGQNRRDFAKCDTPIDPEKKTIVLWGDSHAAHLYPGYEANFGAEYNIVQRTAAMCPPVIGMPIENLPHCKPINGTVSLLIKELMPETVVLAAVWFNYDWRKVETTIQILKSYGIADIRLVGPVPQWSESLPKQLYYSFKADIFKRVPDRIKNGLNPNVLLWDKELESFAKTHGVQYVTPMRILCNEQGCLAKTGETVESLVAWDYGHLTTSGSHFLVSHIPMKQASNVAN